MQVGKTGRLTPVAELEPVALGGTVVRRASLCNEAEIKRLKVGIGNVVFVEKSAEIIPKVMGVAAVGDNGAGIWKMPTLCPSCRKPVTQQEGFVDHYCLNRKCPDQVQARLQHAVGKSALDIDGCGSALIRQLIEHGAQDLYDVFTMPDLSFLKTSARNKFVSGREKAKSAPFWRKLHALGIEGFGVTMCQEIADRWPSLHAALDESDKLRQIVGNVNFEEFLNFFEREGDLVERLIDHGVKFESNERKASGPLAGKAFVITGQMITGVRYAVQEKIVAAGGMVKDHVTSKVNFLVSGSDAGREKAAKARKLNIPIITEDHLYEMMGQQMVIAAAPVADREF